MPESVPGVAAIGGNDAGVTGVTGVTVGPVGIFP